MGHSNHVFGPYSSFFFAPKTPTKTPPATTMANVMSDGNGATGAPDALDVKVKESVKEHEAVAVISGKIHAEKAARKKALTAALEARGVVCGVDPRVPSCEFVVSGTIDGVATTADEVADGEAKRLADWVAKQQADEADDKAKRRGLGLRPSQSGVGGWAGRSPARFEC